MEGLKALIIPVIDWTLRIAGAAALVAVASFYIWWRCL